MRTNNSAITVHHACELSPSLAKLAALGQESLRSLEIVKPLLPQSLTTAIQAGPIDGEVWCLIVSNAATANKLKHFAPIMLSILNDGGHHVSNIRIKVAST